MNFICLRYIISFVILSIFFINESSAENENEGNAEKCANFAISKSKNPLFKNLKCSIFADCCHIECSKIEWSEIRGTCNNRIFCCSCFYRDASSDKQNSDNNYGYSDQECISLKKIMKDVSINEEENKNNENELDLHKEDDIINAEETLVHKEDGNDDDDKRYEYVRDSKLKGAEKVPMSDDIEQIIKEIPKKKILRSISESTKSEKIRSKDENPLNINMIDKLENNFK